MSFDVKKPCNFPEIELPYETTGTIQLGEAL
jgi:hypothetical protein